MEENLRRGHTLTDEYSSISEDDSSDRIILVEQGNSRENYQKENFCSNAIRNTKYNILTFLPKNLFEQFRRVANFYFLVISILTFSPVSPFRGGPFISALIFVLTANAAKEAYEDLKRYKQDKSINESIAYVLRGSSFVATQWQRICVGDIVKVSSENPIIPADMLLLSSSSSTGVAYVETSNLDGETNLKIRFPVSTTASMKSVEQLTHFSGSVKCEQPNSKLDQFSGVLTVTGSDKQVPLGIDQMFIRGTCLRNTDFIYGLVIYTGKETKVALNNSTPRAKKSNIENYTNLMILFVLVFQLVLIIISAVLGGAWEHTTGIKSWYLPKPSSLFTTTILKLFTFQLLYNSLIPISLYVSVEIIRVIQAFFMDWDDDMTYTYVNSDHTISTFRSKCRNSNLNEELGQIQHLFSDKTGTLTSNQMIFRVCSIGTSTFGKIPSVGDAELLERQSSLEELEMKKFKRDTFEDRTLKNLIQKWTKSERKEGELMAEFFKAITLCHAVVPQAKENDIVYASSSPDETALANAAYDVGFKLLERTAQTMTIDILGHITTFEILGVLEFSSERKRMSIIVRDPAGRILLYTKGADSVILERLGKNNREHLHTAINNLQEFANAGLRTLCVAYKEIDPSEFNKWKKLQEAANLSLHDRNLKQTEIYDYIEQGLVLLGVTGIEDKLQEGVPSCIEHLLQAGIKIFVLTGDKQETAINIGRSCNLIRNDHQLIVLNAQTPQRLLDQMEEYLQNIRRDAFQYTLVFHGRIFSMVVQDTAEIGVQLSEGLQDAWLQLARAADCVICCRATPLEKSMVVGFMKKKEKCITMAVGDGANDVSMIQLAHVGVGILGKEGTQAVLASDYAIGQFRYLEKLLLVHGRWSYRRISIFVLYFFFKGVILSMIQLWWSIYSAFSGQTIYDELSLLGYSLVYTSLPIIILAVLDQEVPADLLLRFPQLYKECHQNIYFNYKVFWGWFSLSIYCSLVLYFMPMLAFSDIIHSNGRDAGFWPFAITAYTGVIIVATLKLMLEFRYWTIFHFAAVSLSVIAWFAFAMTYTSIYWVSWNANMYHIVWYLFAAPNFWLTIVISVVVCLLPDVVIKYVQRNYFPLNYQVVQELRNGPSLLTDANLNER